MPEPIEEALGFDISGALQGIGQIDDALTQVTQSFSVGLATALETLTSIGADVPPLAESLDVAGLGPAIDTALADLSAVVPVEADTAGLDSGIADALDAPRPPVDVEGDTAPLSDAIDSAVSVSPVIDVNADTADAAAAIDALNTAPVTVDVDADTSQAQDALDALGTSATSATGGGGGNEGLVGLEGAVLGIKAASGAARGEVGGLTEGIAGISATTAGVVAGGVAFTGFLSETIKLAADAQAQQARFNATFGESAKIVQEIDVGGLRVSLKELGDQTGTLAADLQNSATRIGLLGAASGAAHPEVAKTASSLLGLAGALSASNPRFGDAASVADIFSRALSTGRTRSLIPYGVSLSQTAILQEALKENTDKTKDTLTGYDKLVAGLTLALQQQGDTLGTKYAQGVQGAGIQLRALKVQLEETLTAIGGPLLQPVVESLKSLLPVAQQVGVVLGNVARIVLPLLADLAPALSALNPPLRLVSEGLGVLSALPAPLALGLELVGTALVIDTPLFYLAAAAVETFGAALAVATGPVGIAIAALAALGFVASQAHDEVATAFGTVDTKALTAGFDASANSAGALSDAFGGLNDALEKYLTTQLTAGDAGAEGIDTANALGLSTSDLARILRSSTDDYNRFIASNRIYNLDVTGTNKSQTAFLSTLLQGRDALEESARGTITAAVANGSLSISQAKAAIATTAARDATVAQGGDTHDYIAALRELQPLIDQTTIAQQNQNFASFAGSAAAKDLASSIALGTIKLADAQTVADDNNLTLEQATTLIQRQEQAMVAASIATGQFTQGFLALKPAIADGSVTINDAQSVADELGISFDDAKAAIDSLSTAMDQFVTQGLSALPSAGAAIDDFASGIASAQSNLDSVLSSGSSSSGDAVARAQESANRSISDSAERTTRTVAAAQQKVVEAQRALAEAESQGGKGQAAAVKSAQAHLQTALDGLTKARADAGQKQADAVRSGSRKVSDAQDAANQKSAEEAQKVRDAQAALIAAQDPQRVIDAENAQIFRILSFQQNLAVLLRRGRDQVVAQLVAEGPERGAALASSLVNDDAKAKALDSGLALGQKIREGYAGFLQNPKIKAELSGFLVTLADGTTVPLSEAMRTSGEKAAGSLLNGLSGGLSHATGLTSTAHTGAAVLGSAIDTATAGAKKKGEDAGAAAQTGFTTSFTPETAAATAIGKVPAAIAGGIGASNVAATSAGDAVAARFHPNFAAQILPAMLTVVASVQAGAASIAPFIAEEGATLGTAFGDGFAGGLILAGPDVTFAAGALADEAVAAIRKALGIKSPSSVGVDIGQQFVAGVAQGLSELSPLHQATAALALALIPDIRPALRQIPSLAPAITSAGQQIATRPVAVAAPASTQPSSVPSKNVAVSVQLHKVDVNPKHLADEIAWTIG